MTDSASAIAFLGADFQKYRDTLYEAVLSNEPYLSRINKYVLGSRGKEIRPVISLLTGRSCASLTPVSFYCAAVSEMLHTATLMHDDVADAASMRRGHLSVSAMFSPSAAVLAGDFWLSRVMHILTSQCSREIVSCFTDAVQKMSESELFQMEKASSLDTTENDYYSIIYGKTAALFIACIKSAALAVNADAKTLDALEIYAENFGLAFQIRDDILDYSPSLDTGKKAGTDLKERKITLPLLGVMKEFPEHTSEIISSLGEINLNIEGKSKEDAEKEKVIVDKITSLVHSCKGVDYAQQKLERHIQVAVDALSALPSSEERKMLIDIAEYLGRRDR